MTTPTGLPAKGDKVTHKDGTLFTIVKREGSGVLYSVVLKREDGESVSGNHALGYPKDHIRINEFPWWLGQGLFQLVEP